MGGRRELALSQSCVRTQDPPASPAALVQQDTLGGGQCQDGATQGSSMLADPLHRRCSGPGGRVATVAPRPPAETPPLRTKVSAQSLQEPP